MSKQFIPKTPVPPIEITRAKGSEYAVREVSVMKNPKAEMPRARGAGISEIRAMPGNALARTVGAEYAGFRRAPFVAGRRAVFFCLPIARAAADSRPPGGAIFAARARRRGVSLFLLRRRAFRFFGRARGRCAAAPSIRLRTRDLGKRRYHAALRRVRVFP